MIIGGIMMEPWMMWIGIGVICLIIEIFTPMFLFMSFGIAAIITGLISIASMPLWLQLAIFVVVSFIIFLNLRKFSKKLSKVDYPSNVAALVGKYGTVTEAIPDDGKGYVKIGGETWSAVSENGLEIPLSARIQVVKLDGNKLIVKKIEE
jgi:membrane protein implicated in regulation of membrane protease activity